MEKKSFAEILAEVKDANPNPRGSDFSNREPEPLSDQAGHHLSLVGELRPASVRQLVLDGVPLAWDPCGCCDFPPLWIDPDRARAAAKKGKPVLREGNACATYLDLWRDACGDVVVAHGEVDWPGALE